MFYRLPTGIFLCSGDVTRLYSLIPLNIVVCILYCMLFGRLPGSRQLTVIFEVIILYVYIIACIIICYLPHRHDIGVVDIVRNLEVFKIYRVHASHLLSLEKFKSSHHIQRGHYSNLTTQGLECLFMLSS